jgi:hypothetical protein
VSRVRATILGVGLALTASLGACGRMSQAGCVGEQYATVRNMSRDPFEVMLHYRERASDPHPIGTVPAGAAFDFEIPRGTYVTVRYQYVNQRGGSYVPSELHRISYSCR